MAHPAEIHDNGGYQHADYSYLEGPQPPIGTTFQDAYIGPEADVMPRIGSDPEDMMVTGPDGQLHSVNANQQRTGERYDHVTDVAPHAIDRQAATEQAPAVVAPGTVALHGVNVRSPRIYRSNAVDGGHAKRRAVASHRREE